MRMTTLIVGIAISLLVTVPSSAAHSDVQATVIGGQIVVGALDDFTGDVTANVRVFGYDFQEDPADPYFAGDPGFDAPAGSGLSTGALSFNLLSGTRFNLPANLNYWNGIAPLSFGAVPSGETLRLNLGSANRIVDNSIADVAGFSIGNVSMTGTLHRHLNSFLNGADGNSNPNDGNVPANGIYLLAMELDHADVNLANSAPLFFVFNNGMSEAVHDQAIDWAEANLVAVPEPSTIAMAISGGLFGLLFVARQRRRTV